MIKFLKPLKKDTEDEEEHKRRDFVHSNAAHFSRISEFDNKKTKKKKKKKEKRSKTVTDIKDVSEWKRHSRKRVDISSRFLGSTGK